MSPSPGKADAGTPVAKSLLALAPLHLPNRRVARYKADDICVSLNRLVERDQIFLRKLYQVLTEMLLSFVDSSADDAQRWRDLKLWIERNNLDTLIDEVRALGISSHEHDPSENLSKAMHDVRGGALSALLGRLQLLALLPRSTDQLQTLFVLVRDHLKIMRSAVIGLDEARRIADHQPKSHAMELIINKWHESVVGPKWREKPVRMFVDCRYEGALTECCLESAAVDRIFYNLANNACRHAVDERIDMTIFPVSELPDGCLRFVLSNEVSETDAAYLNSLVSEGGADSADRGNGLSLFKLFEPAVSTTGSGYGLTVVANFVAGAFGLRDNHEALRERYVGAVLEGRTFRTWFHWPIADNALPPKLDDFHHPKESLSEE